MSIHRIYEVLNRLEEISDNAYQIAVFIEKVAFAAHHLRGSEQRDMYNCRCPYTRTKEASVAIPHWFLLFRDILI